MDDTNQTTVSDQNTQADTDSRVDAMLKEMQAMRQQMDIELQEDVDELEEDFMSERHYLHVTDEAISEELARGLRAMNDAGDGISLPEDDTDEDI